MVLLSAVAFLPIFLILLLLSANNYCSAIMSASSEHYRLSGQVICLSGASSGIGAAIASALYQEGAKVCIGARRVERLEAVAKDCKSKFPDSPGEFVCAPLDVTDRASVQDFVKKACQDYKVNALDGMVCCAGVMYFTKMKVSTYYSIILYV
jgi:NADP-dependent 3-hydroxy acid dehydrogenase YdfG